MIQSALEELARLQRETAAVRAESRRLRMTLCPSTDAPASTNVITGADQEAASGGASPEQRRRYVLEQLERPAVGSSIDWPRARFIEDVPAEPTTTPPRATLDAREAQRTIEIPLETRIAIMRLRVDALVNGPRGGAARARARRCGRRADPEAGVEDAAPASERGARDGETVLSRADAAVDVVGEGEGEGEGAPPGYVELSGEVPPAGLRC